MSIDANYRKNVLVLCCGPAGVTGTKTVSCEDYLHEYVANTIESFGLIKIDHAALHAIFFYDVALQL